jgi:PAS domain S-box-containing protein
MQIKQNKLLLEALGNNLENNYEKFIDSAPVGMYILQDGLFCYCNLKLARMLGYETEDLIYKKGISNLTFPGDQPRVENNFINFLKSDLDSDHESLRVICKDKKIFEAEIYYAKTNLNGGFAIIGTLIDVTENKNKTEQLDILAHAIKCAGECVTITDLDHRIFYVNETLCKTFGYTAEELRGKYVGILHQNVVEDAEFRNIIKATYETGWQGELLSRRKDGTIFPIWLTTTLVKDKNEKPLALVGLSQDISNRKKSIEDLNKSERKIRTLIDKMPDGLVYLKMICDEKTQAIDFEIVQVNKSFENLMNINAENVIGKTVSSQFPDFHNLDVNLPESFELICKNKTDKKFEVYFKSMDKYYSISAYSPEEHHLVAIVKDITIRKKAEDELIKSQHMLRTILDNVPQRVFWKDSDSIFRGCNIHFAKDLGFDNPDEIVGKTDYEVDYENMAEEFISCDRYVMDNDDPLMIDCEKHYKPDGTPFWIRLNKVPLKDKSNNIFGIVGTYEDISKQKITEENIRKLSQAVEQNPASIVITDLNGNIEYVNSKFTRLTGYTFEEVRGKNPRILKSGDMSHESYKEMWQTIKSGNDWVGEFHNRKKNGELYWEYASVSPIKDDEGKVTHYLAVKEDITAKKNFEVELKAAKDKAEEMNRLKSIFLANISHELRTPLIGIIGYAETLHNEIENPEFKEMAHTLLKSGMRLKETLNLLLDLSHIEADRLEISLLPKNLTQIILEKIKVYHFSAQEKGLQFQIIIKEENLYVKIDENMFAQVIDNLFNNAIKYTNKGEISILLDKTEENNKHFARIIVRDSGIGIPAHSLNLIFEPFRQVSEGLSRTFEGMGLGLTITKRFIEIMGGNVSVKSEVGKGTEFIVQLPLSQDEDFQMKLEDEVRADVPNNTSFHKYKYSSEILLIEDDEPTANIIKIYLNDICRTDWANTGETAIDMIKKKDYSVVLVDINLGMGMDGLETIKEMKKINGYKNIPIIAVTAYAMHGDREKFLKQGCTHYISKPFEKKEIGDLLEEILTKKVSKKR